MTILHLVIGILLTVSPFPAHALEFQEGADAPTRTIEDYIKDYVDIPEGAIDWKVFGKTKEINIQKKDSDGLDLQFYKPGFPPEVAALNGQTIRIKGFMFPLDGTEEQSLFLFGPFPINCPFQYHVGPSLVIEAHTGKKPITFSYEPLVLEGRLELVPEDPENSVFYRLKDAKLVN